MLSRRLLAATGLASALAFLALAQTRDPGWTAYGHDPGGTRFSPLTQIDRKNVSQLKVAWVYHTGALQPASDLNGRAAFESTAILVDGLLYLTTPFNQIVALDPTTGRPKWKSDSQVSRTPSYSEVTNRGVAAWTDSRAAANAPCRLRLFEGTIDARLLAVDGKTGKLCADFGDAGAIDLTAGIKLVGAGDYQVTSAPTVVGDLVITGSSIGDNRAVSSEQGIVRAYDARTGKLRWSWDPIPWSNQQTQRTGAANAWSTFAADPARDLIFIPTGSASPDFYGGIRPGDNRYANSVVALKASTGALVWSYQVVHHDLWDYDVAPQPALIDFNGHPAVAINTKMGNVFVVDRVNGKPLMRVDERPVPKSDVPGEEASTTQPMPAWSALVPQKLSADDAWGPTPEDRAFCKQRIAELRNEGMFTPPSLKGTLVFPGNVGGVNWGSAAWDASRNLLFMNTNRLATRIGMVRREDLPAFREAAAKVHRDIEYGRQTGTPFVSTREWLFSPSGAPCNAPPWGALVAFDLKSGKVRWESPIGEVKPGMPGGSPNLGGPIATAGGLIFTAAGMGEWLRAFDADTGAEVWKGELPASAQSTPMTYQQGGKQYIVICAGGHGKLKTKMGDAVVAFALPTDLRDR